MALQNINRSKRIPLWSKTTPFNINCLVNTRADLFLESSHDWQQKPHLERKERRVPGGKKRKWVGEVSQSGRVNVNECQSAWLSVTAVRVSHCVCVCVCVFVCVFETEWRIQSYSHSLFEHHPCALCNNCLSKQNWSIIIAVVIFEIKIYEIYLKKLSGM